MNGKDFLQEKSLEVVGQGRWRVSRWQYWLSRSVEQGVHRLEQQFRAAGIVLDPRAVDGRLGSMDQPGYCLTLVVVELVVDLQPTLTPLSLKLSPDPPGLMDKVVEPHSIRSDCDGFRFLWGILIHNDTESTVILLGGCLEISW